VGFSKKERYELLGLMMLEGFAGVRPQWIRIAAATN